MKNKNAPMKGRGNCIAGAHDSTANPSKTQSRADQRTGIQELRDSGRDIKTYLQWDTDATVKQHKQGLYILQGCDV